jgi:hypothetical protein
MLGKINEDRIADENLGENIIFFSLYDPFVFRKIFSTIVFKTNGFFGKKYFNV